MSTESGPTPRGASGAVDSRIRPSTVVVSLIVGICAGLVGGGLAGYVVARSNEKPAQDGAQSAEQASPVDGERSNDGLDVDLDYVNARREACINAGTAAANLAASISRLQRVVRTRGEGRNQKPTRVDASLWDARMKDYETRSTTFLRSMAAYRLFFDRFLKDDVPEDILNVIDRSLALIRTELSAEAWQRLEDRRRVISTWIDELPKRCRGK